MKNRNFKNRLSTTVAFIFIWQSVIMPPSISLAQQSITAPAVVVQAPIGITEYLKEPSFMLHGLRINPMDQLQFDFLFDQGETSFNEYEFQAEVERVAQYFVAALTTPDESLWVNLSPYEEDRVIENSLGATRLGRDMLAMDYLLKQKSASASYAETQAGKIFWEKAHAIKRKLFADKKVPIDIFNKVWIIPEKAVLFQKHDKVVIVESSFDLLMEEDYLAFKQAQLNESSSSQKENTEESKLAALNRSTAELFKEELLPLLKEEVNHGAAFANLRQMYHAMILATWYKEQFPRSLLGQTFLNQSKVAGFKLKNETVTDEIYDQYVEAFKRGVYNYIKEDFDPSTQKYVPRKYFSGGLEHAPENVQTLTDQSMLIRATNVFKKGIIAGSISLMCTSCAFFNNLNTELTATMIASDRMPINEIAVPAQYQSVVNDVKTILNEGLRNGRSLEEIVSAVEFKLSSGPHKQYFDDYFAFYDLYKSGEDYEDLTLANLIHREFIIFGFNHVLKTFGVTDQEKLNTLVEELKGVTELAHSRDRSLGGRHISSGDSRIVIIDPGKKNFNSMMVLTVHEAIHHLAISGFFVEEKRFDIHGFLAQALSFSYHYRWNTESHLARSFENIPLAVMRRTDDIKSPLDAFLVLRGLDREKPLSEWTYRDAVKRIIEIYPGDSEPQETYTIGGAIARYGWSNYGERDGFFYARLTGQYYDRLNPAEIEMMVRMKIKILDDYEFIGNHFPVEEEIRLFVQNLGLAEDMTYREINEVGPRHVLSIVPQLLERGMIRNRQKTELDRMKVNSLNLIEQLFTGNQTAIESALTKYEQLMESAAQAGLGRRVGSGLGFVSNNIYSLIEGEALRQKLLDILTNYYALIKKEEEAENKESSSPIQADIQDDQSTEKLGGIDFNPQLWDYELTGGIVDLNVPANFRPIDPKILDTLNPQFIGIRSIPNINHLFGVK